jgi:hypothetical protein
MAKMNLYLVLALALGAATPAAIASPSTIVVAAKQVRAQRAVPFSVRRSSFTVVRQRPAENGERTTANDILTGAASPRAPAFSC